MEIDTVGLAVRGHDSAEPECVPSSTNFSRRSLLAGEPSVPTATAIHAQESCHPAGSCQGPDSSATGRETNAVCTSGKGPLAFRLLAVSAVGAGGLGVVLPLVPTTPFLLLALWAASKGSPELHERIRTDPRFRPTLEAWQRDRAVPLKAKLLALLLMASSWLMLWLTGAGTGVLLAVGLLLLGVATFLLSRPTARVQR